MGHVDSVAGKVNTSNSQPLKPLGYGLGVGYFESIDDAGSQYRGLEVLLCCFYFTKAR